MSRVVQCDYCKRVERVDAPTAGLWLTVQPTAAVEEADKVHVCGPVCLHDWAQRQIVEATLAAERRQHAPA